MAPFTHHIFVCCNRRAPSHARGCCDPPGAQQLRQSFKQEIARRGLKLLVRANQAGCLDQCELGPTVVIYPQGIWYGGVRPEHVAQIIERTVENGQVIDELLIPGHLLNTKGKRPPDDASESSEPVEPS